MPPRKKAAASSGGAAQGRPGRRKNISPEVVADTDSGDEFEHLTIEAEDRYVSTCLFIYWYLYIDIYLIALMR